MITPLNIVQAVHDQMAGFSGSFHKVTAKELVCAFDKGRLMATHRMWRYLYSDSPWQQYPSGTRELDRLLVFLTPENSVRLISFYRAQMAFSSGPNQYIGSDESVDFLGPSQHFYVEEAGQKGILLSRESLINRPSGVLRASLLMSNGAQHFVNKLLYRDALKDWIERLRANLARPNASENS